MAHQDPPPAPHDRSDFGCLLGLVAIFIAVGLGPALLLLGGAPLIPLIIGALVIAVIVPWVNPTERYPDAKKWIGRTITFIILVALFIGGLLLLPRFLQSSDPYSQDQDPVQTPRHSR